MKYYLMAFVPNPLTDNTLYCPAGTSHMIIVSGSKEAATKLAIAMKLRTNAEEVWLLPKNLYTQKTCELEPSRFYQYVKRYGYKML